MTSQEVIIVPMDGLPTNAFVSSTPKCVQDENLRIFFRCFLIVHLARAAAMEGYLGFTPPKALALLYCVPLNPK